jgi:TRAP transporter TAXI family solute receptor
MSKRTLAASVVALIALVHAGTAQAAPQRLTIGTAGTTGVFYIYGGALANVITKYVPGVEATAQATGGSVENMRLLQNKKIDIATVAGDVAFQGYHDYKNSKYFKTQVEVRALFNMYSEPQHVVALASSAINSVGQLKGKRVVVGAPGSGTEVKARMILQALGINYKDFTPEYLTFDEGTDALQDNVVNAAFLGVATPAPAIVNLAFNKPIKLIPFSNEEVTKIAGTYPFLFRDVIPANMYKGVDKDTQTVAVQTLVVCRPDLPDDVVYKFVKAVFEHKDELNAIHNAFKVTTLQNATPTIVPIHPGAKKYFEEMKAYKEQR